MIEMAAQKCEVASNRTCQICEEHEASHFCDCLSPHPLFCKNCPERHTDKYPHALHHVIPIVAMNQNPEEYLQKHHLLEQRKVQLRRNVEQLDHFCFEFDHLMQNCLNYLAEYRRYWGHYMQREREKLVAAVEAAVKETERCLDRGLEPVSALAQALWKLPLHVVRYSITAPDLKTLCESCASYQNNLQLICERFSMSQCLALVVPTRVKILDLGSMTWSTVPLTTPIHVDIGSRWVWVEAGLFCCGSIST